MKVVVLSDTHGRHQEIDVPDGDLLIHCGDFCSHGGFGEAKRFNQWLYSLPHPHKIVIAGNHDIVFEKCPEIAQECLSNCIYLEDSFTIVEGFKIYGSPWQPAFFDWAFQLPRGKALREKWNLIPVNVDLLITHGPPYGIGDYTSTDEHVGCEELLKAVKKIRPKYHLFGHIHEGYGVYKEKNITFVNASNCNENYQSVNPPIVLEFKSKSL